MKDFFATIAGVMVGVLFFVLIWGSGGSDNTSLAGKSKTIFDNATTEMITKVKVN